MKLGAKYEILNTAIRDMAGKVIIDVERCKGCGLCVTVCPKNCIEISDKSNKHGYFPARLTNCDCTGCAMCAIICPDAVIEVQREDSEKITTVAGPGRKSKPTLVEEKA